MADELVDAATQLQNATRLGLVTEAQVAECRDETGTDVPEVIVRALERKRYLTPWQTAKLRKGDTDGYFLGGYRLLYKIASGTFGRVFRADDPRTGRVVAIKVLRQRWSEDHESLQQNAVSRDHVRRLFEREGKVGQALRHPNIVEILAVNCDQETHQFYIVMEFVEGGNLRDFLGIRKKLEPKEALRLLEECVNGLMYAYSQGLTHRDLKPTNILISAQGAAKLVDFGLAGAYAAAGGPAADGKVFRTVDYAGLETTTGVKSGDTRSDIFFLGCVLYEMLTGRPALEANKDAAAAVQRARFKNVPTLSPADGDIPPSVCHLVNTMMSLSPQDRFQTPSQLLEAVRRVRAELEGGAGAGRAVEPSVFVVEQDARLQDSFRKLKDQGFRVFLSTNLEVAIGRYRQKPFDALILDARGAQADVIVKIEDMLREAARQRRKCAALVIVSKEDQENWSGRVQRPELTLLPEPVTLKQVARRLKELAPVG